MRASGMWVRGGLGIEESLVAIVLVCLFSPLASLAPVEEDGND